MTSNPKNQTPLSTLTQIPKVELHRHLELSIRHSTLRELAPQVGISVPESEAGFRDLFLVTEPMKDLGAVLNKFLATQAVLHSEEVLTRITFEAIEDAANEGIRILELRYAPTFIHEGHEHLNFEKIHASIVKGVEMARAKNLPIAVGLLATIQRIRSVEIAEKVADFAIDHRDHFVGIDLADNEVGFDSAPFSRVFLKAKKAGLHITVHSGEADVPEAANYVRQAIELLGAERIGHGVQIYKSPEVMEFVKEKRVPLELCPTSNWLTNAVASTASHPFRQLMEAGVPVTINSDDPGVFNIDLTNEYRVLRDEHGFTEAEFNHCNDIAAANSFIPLKEKQKHWPRPINAQLASWSK